MNKESNGKIKLAEGRLGEWIDGYLSGKIDTSIFAVLVILDRIFTLDISPKINAHLEMIISSLIEREPLSPKEVQEINNALNGTRKAFNFPSGTERDEEIETNLERIYKISKLRSKL